MPTHLVLTRATWSDRSWAAGWRCTALAGWSRGQGAPSRTPGARSECWGPNFRNPECTWISSILSELSQITRESFILRISSSCLGNQWSRRWRCKKDCQKSVQMPKFTITETFDLLKSEWGRPSTVLVPETIAKSVVVKLLAYDARQGGTDLPIVVRYKV